jgi:hypothetical protein
MEGVDRIGEIGLGVLMIIGQIKVGDRLRERVVDVVLMHLFGGLGLESGIDRAWWGGRGDEGVVVMRGGCGNGGLDRSVGRREEGESL